METTMTSQRIGLSVNKVALVAVLLLPSCVGPRYQIAGTGDYLFRLDVSTGKVEAISPTTVALQHGDWTQLPDGKKQRHVEAPGPYIGGDPSSKKK